MFPASGKRQKDDASISDAPPITRASLMYKRGDSIVARYTKTSLWYAGLVVDMDYNGSMIKIKWLDGDRVGAL